MCVVGLVLVPVGGGIVLAVVVPVAVAVVVGPAVAVGESDACDLRPVCQELGPLILGVLGLLGQEDAAAAIVIALDLCVS